MQQPVINTDDSDEWWNPKCEEEFKISMEIGLVKPMFLHKRKRKVNLDETEAFGRDGKRIHPE